MSGQAAMRIAARMMADRLKVWQKLQIQARERGETTIELNVAELFESADAEALAAFHTANDEINGARPLPLEYQS